MNKTITAIVLTGFLAYVLGIYSTLPWWSFTISSLLVSVAIHQQPGKSFCQKPWPAIRCNARRKKK